MSAVRQDYLLRQIDLLRQFVARLVRQKSDPDLNEALLQAFNLQEKLFPLPPAEFLQLDLPEQIAALRRNESALAGDDKCRAYADLLAETAQLYELKGEPDFAAGARQLALFAALSVIDRAGDDAEMSGLARELLGKLEPQTLHAPVIALLETLRSKLGSSPNG